MNISFVCKTLLQFASFWQCKMQVNHFCITLFDLNPNTYTGTLNNYIVANPHAFSVRLTHFTPTSRRFPQMNSLPHFSRIHSFHKNLKFQLKNSKKAGFGSFLRPLYFMSNAYKPNVDSVTLVLRDISQYYVSISLKSPFFPSP